MDFQTASNLFNTARDKTKGKPIGNNTRLVKYGDGFGIELHNTIVVLIHPDNTLTLDTGGWYTRTTKDRINSYLPDNLGVYSHKGDWKLFNRNRHKPIAEFNDGMRITRDGKVLE